MAAAARVAMIVKQTALPIHVLIKGETVRVRVFGWLYNCVGFIGRWLFTFGPRMKKKIHAFIAICFKSRERIENFSQPRPKAVITSNKTRIENRKTRLLIYGSNVIEDKSLDFLF